MIQGNMFRLNTFVIALFTSDVGIKDISGMVKTYNLCCFLVPRRGGGVLPIMAYTRRLRPKGVPFSGFWDIKG